MVLDDVTFHGAWNQVAQAESLVGSATEVTGGDVDAGHRDKLDSVDSVPTQ